MLPKELVRADYIPIQIYEEEQFLQSEPGVADKLYADWLAKRIQLEQNKRRERYQPTSVTLVMYSYPGFTKTELGNCYNFVRDDILIGYGAARNHPAPLKDPEIGEIMVSYESASGHYAKVIGVLNDEFVVAEFNYIRGAYTERIIKKGSPQIKGFYKKV